MNSLTLCILLSMSSTLIPVPGMAQASEQSRTVVINDNSGRVGVVQMAGKTYVELAAFIQLAHGTITVQGDQFILTLPGTANRSAVPGVEEQTTAGLSREFRKAGIEEISTMREWASTLANAIQNGYPITDSWVASYRGEAERGLRVASAAIVSDADRNAFQLLNREFENVRDWSNKLLEARKSLSAAQYSLSSTALQNDPHSQKIVSCAHFLGSMLSNGEFQDDNSCH